VEFAELRSRPRINAAFLWKIGGELNDSEPLRDKKEDRRQDPQSDRTRSRLRRRRYPGDPKNRDQIEQDEVAQRQATL